LVEVSEADLAQDRLHVRYHPAQVTRAQLLECVAAQGLKGTFK
jgi:hypothetical protein